MKYLNPTRGPIPPQAARQSEAVKDTTPFFSPSSKKDRTADERGSEVFFKPAIQAKMAKPGQRATNNTGMPDQLKSGIENLSGYSMDDVKVHYNSSEPAQLQAYAFAKANQIHVGPGQEKHLPHEAWHVVQQKQQRVMPTRQMKRGVQVNDDAGLEHEADVMGSKAMDVGMMTTSSSPATGPVVSSDTVQRTSIKSAGLELELKGAALTETPGKSFEEHKKIYDRVNWWIEIDSDHPELVTTSTESRAQLFTWLTEGLITLNEFQLMGKLISDYAAFPDQTIPAAKVVFDKIQDGIARLNLPVTTDGGLTGTEYLAKPQISFGIQKGKLAEFSRSVMGGEIKYTEGYTKTGVKHENEMWPRVNDLVTKLYYASPIWQNDKGKEFIAKMGTATVEAQGLSMMTIITLLFAMRFQDPVDEWQYYKARFSVMPRVPMSDLYDAMPLASQIEYEALMKLWSDAIHAYNVKGTTDVKDQHPETFRDATKSRTFSYLAELESIVDKTKRNDKAMKDGSTKKVDMLSSDDIASTSNVGASVGAYNLPVDSDGIYEIRSMPYIKIDETAKVTKTYEEVIDAFGGMHD